MNQSAQSASGDETHNEMLDPYQKKFKRIFQEEFDVLGDEELDYEYSDDECKIAEEFPSSYSWSPPSSRYSSVCSSPNSSRAPSPVGSVINLLDDDDELSAKRHSAKKLSRNFDQMYKIKRRTLSSYIKRHWKKSGDFSGTLKRWRIRSLDAIFIKDNSRYRLPRIRERVININSDSVGIQQEPTVSEFSVVINNDCYMENRQNEPSVDVTQLPPVSDLRRNPNDCDNSSVQINSLSEPSQLEIAQLSAGSPNVIHRSQSTAPKSCLLTAVGSQLHKLTVQNPGVSRYIHTVTPLRPLVSKKFPIQCHSPLRNYAPPINFSPSTSINSRTAFPKHAYPSVPVPPFPYPTAVSYRPGFVPRPSYYGTVENPSNFFNPPSNQDNQNVRYP